jgi:hypothetical protein
LCPNGSMLIADKTYFIYITPVFAAGLERSGKPVRQHALVKHLAHEQETY